MIKNAIKLKTEICGLKLWGHDIDVLIKMCKDANIDIAVPKLIVDKANMYEHWEVEFRCYSNKVCKKR